MQLNSSFHFCDSFGKLRGNDRDLLLFLWGLGLSVNQLSPQDHDLVVARLAFIVELQQDCLRSQMENIDVEIQRQMSVQVFLETEGQRGRRNLPIIPWCLARPSSSCRYHVIC